MLRLEPTTFRPTSLCPGCGPAYRHLPPITWAQTRSWYLGGPSGPSKPSLGLYIHLSRPKTASLTTQHYRARLAQSFLCDRLLLLVFDFVALDNVWHFNGNNQKDIGSGDHFLWCTISKSTPTFISSFKKDLLSSKINSVGELFGDLSLVTRIS